MSHRFGITKALFEGEDGAGQGAGGAAGGAQADGGQASGGGNGASAAASSAGNDGKAGLLAAAAASGAKPADGQQQGDGQGQQSVIQRPDNIPEQFWDAKEGKLNTDALLKAHKDTKADYDRLKAQGTSKAPEKPEDYKFDGLKDVEHVRAPTADDPGLKMWRGIAHKHGLTQAQAQGIAADMLAGSVAFVPKPINVEAEMESLGKNGKAMVDGVYQWVLGAKERGLLNDGEMARVLDLGSDAMGIRALAKLRELSGEKPFAMTHVLGDGELPTKDEWTVAFGKAVAAGDTALIAKLEKQGEALFGTDPAGTSERNLGVAPRPAA